jgi:hypothetical protein
MGVPSPGVTLFSLLRCPLEAQFPPTITQLSRERYKMGVCKREV